MLILHINEYQFLVKYMSFNHKIATYPFMNLTKVIGRKTNTCIYIQILLLIAGPKDEMHLGPPG